MHPLLQRQLQKHLGTATDLPPALQPLIAAIDQAYTQADDDRAMFEHSADLAAVELLERNRELTSRNQELAAVREAALDCIIAMDHQGLVTEFNPAAERTFGYRRDQVLGKQLSDFLIPPAFRDRHQQGLARYVAGGNSTVVGKRIEIPARRADGSEFPVELAISAVRAAAPDAPPRFVAYLRDISDRKAAEAQARHAEKLALVASRTDNAVVITDAHGLIEWVNEGFTRISEYTLDEVVGQKPGAFLQGPDTDPETVASIRRSIARGQGFKAEILNYAKSGRTYWLAIEAQPIRDAAGNICNFIAIESDVTERKRMVEDLRAAKDAAEGASRAKSEFLANMSHEIRTPLNGVIGMVDLLLGTRLDERQSRYAQVVKSSADTLLALISQILDFSKIEAGKLDLDETPFDLRLAVEDVAEMLAQKAATKGLELACRIDPAVPTLVHGDPDRLRQILINLVNNAIKFTQKGEVLIRVLPDTPASSPSPGTPGEGRGGGSSPTHHSSLITPSSPLLRFEVSDTGIGIPPDRMHRLFKSFSQVDASTTRRFGGTGLGLAISKQLAELMGGQIGARSDVGHGSTFWFTARLAPVAHQAAAKLPLDLTGRRVLVVDDNPTHAHILREQLAAWRVDVACAGSGPEAIQTIERAAAFDMAILDLRMPDMDGLELAAALRQRPAAADLRLVLLSGVEVLAPERYRAAGFAAAMAKPVRQSTLFDTLMRVMAAPRGTALGDSLNPATVSAPQPVTTMTTKNARILLAEDNEINQLVATELLARAGYSCDAVPDGAQAVTAAATGRYALILMDCQMPELDGFEATRAIRRAEQAAAHGAHIPILALTANAVKGDRERCLDAGMDAYVTKPLNPKELLETIETCLKSAQAAPPASLDVGCSMLNVGCSSSSSHEQPPSPPAIDVPSLLSRCMGNVTFLEKMLTKFQEQSAATLSQITTSISSRDAASAARAAHALKGAAANLSAPRVTEIAAQLEHLARAARLDSADAALVTLKSEMDQCLADIPAAITRAKTLTPTT